MAVEERPGAERRSEPRILPGAALELRARRSATGERVYGRLIDASPRGLAFACEDELGPSELLDVELYEVDGGACLEGVQVRVVGVRGDAGDTLVHCAFCEPPRSEWLAALEA